MNEYRRTVWAYYAYEVTTSHGFWLPFGVLYVTRQGHGLDVVGLTQSALLVVMVALELPAGYVADRVGRRTALAVGNVVVAAVMGLYAVVDSAAGYVVLYGVWGVAFAFHSAIDDAWLYDLLDERFDATEFARTSGRAEAIELAASAGAALAAGLLWTVAPSLPFLANAALAACGLPLLAALPATRGADAEVVAVRDAVQALRVQLARPAIRWLVVYAALFNVLFSATRWLEQPTLDALGVPAAALGALYAVFKLVSAAASATTGRLQETLGVRGFFALLAPVCALAYAAVAVLPAFAIPVLFLRRVLDRVSGPIRNQYVNDRLEGVGRATVLSGVAMAMNLASGTANAVVGPVAESMGPLGFLPVAGVTVGVAAGVLWLGASPVRDGSGGSTTPRGAPAAD